MVLRIPLVLSVVETIPSTIVESLIACWIIVRAVSRGGVLTLGVKFLHSLRGLT